VNGLNAWGLDQPTDEQRTQEAQQLVDAVLDRVRQPLIDVVIVFFEKQIGPLTLMAFQIALLGPVRELGRQLLEGALNACEPGRPGELPKDLWLECGGYRRRNQ
jgi:hypothetical protein